MRLQDFIDRLDAQLSIDIKGIADLAAAQANLQRDTCFVLYIDVNAAKNTLMNGVRQQTRIGIGAVLALTNRRGTTGAAGLGEIENRRLQIQNALLGWQPPGAAGMVTYRRGRLLNFNDQTLWWQDEYEVDGLIEPAIQLVAADTTSTASSPVDNDEHE